MQEQWEKLVTCSGTEWPNVAIGTIQWNGIYERWASITENFYDEDKTTAAGRGKDQACWGEGQNLPAIVGRPAKVQHRGRGRVEMGLNGWGQGGRRGKEQKDWAQEGKGLVGLAPAISNPLPRPGPSALINMDLHRWYKWWRSELSYRGCWVYPRAREQMYRGEISSQKFPVKYSEAYQCSWIDKDLGRIGLLICLLIIFFADIMLRLYYG